MRGLPAGTYLSVIGNVRIGAGGQTRLALLRHRLFQRHAGVELPIVTFNPVESYDPVREHLLEEGLLLPGSRLLNMHEDLRAQVVDGPELDVEVPAVVGTGPVEDEGWRRRWSPGTPTETWEYVRPDGTPWLVTPPTDVAGPVLLLGPDGGVRSHLPDIGSLWRQWLVSRLPSTGHVFLISDSRFIATELSRLDADADVLLLHQMHNPHLVGSRTWSSPVSPSYRRSMEELGRLDALISLTDRQRDDIALRYGRTTNLFTIPNPVEPAAPGTAARVPDSIAMIARLDGQKRLDRAVDAFALVHAERPTARLDVFGDGPLREELEQRTAAAGLSDAVTWHGHVPGARDRLDEASLFWLTSDFEGYPLSTLEAMSHGCPVVSMDMPYGPREQVSDGVDGALVPFGDVEQQARRTLDLLADPDALEAMRDAARAKAAEHGHERFLADWADVLHHAVDQRPLRRRIDRAEWHVDTRRLTGDPVFWAGTLDLETDVDDLGDLTLVADAFVPGRASLLHLPMTVERDRRRLTFSGSTTRDSLRRGLRGKQARIRLQLVWRNEARTREVGIVDLVEPPGPARRLVRTVRRALRG